MRPSPEGCCTGSRAPLSMQCVWARRKCLPARQKPSANWAGSWFPRKMRCGGRWIGSGPTDMSRVAIVAALEREVRPLVKHWRVSEKEYGGRRFRFFEKDEFVL